MHWAGAGVGGGVGDRVAGFGVPLTGVSVGNEPVGDVGDVGAMVGRVHQIESMHTVLHKPLLRQPDFSNGAQSC